MQAAGLSPDPPGQGDLGPASSRDVPGSPGDTPGPGSPRSAPRFDLLGMVVSYRRMALFLEPASDALELSRSLLGCVAC